MTHFPLLFPAIVHLTQPRGCRVLYASDFHRGRVDVFNSAFVVGVYVPGAFMDSDLPAGYAPFGIQNIGGTIYVTYALQDADAHDDVAGVGHGFVDAYESKDTLFFTAGPGDERHGLFGTIVRSASR